MPLESISMYMYIYIYNSHRFETRFSSINSRGCKATRFPHQMQREQIESGAEQILSWRGRYGRRRIGRGEAPKAGDLGHLWPANGLPRRSIAIRMISTREAGRKENFRIIGDRGTREFLSLRITFTHQHDQEINSRNSRGIFCRIVGVMMFYWEE